jgi:hypothetical protein
MTTKKVSEMTSSQSPAWQGNLTVNLKQNQNKQTKPKSKIMKTKFTTIALALIATVVTGHAQNAAGTPAVKPAAVSFITASGKAVPITSVTAFSTKFDAALKNALGNLGGAGQLSWGAIIDKKVTTKVARDVVTDILDTRLIVWGNASAMTTEQVAALRMGLRARAQVAATTKQALSELAVGKLSANIFEGRLYKAPTVNVGVAPVDNAAAAGR